MKATRRGLFSTLCRRSGELFGATGATGASARPAVMPMDAYRYGEHFIVHFDLPGVDPASIDLDHNVLTVRAERRPNYGEEVELQVAERPCGVFSRQLFLGDTLDADRIEAHYDAGVLTLRIPIAEKAKPRKIEIIGGSAPQVINA